LSKKPKSCAVNSPGMYGYWGCFSLVNNKAPVMITKKMHVTRRIFISNLFMLCPHDLIAVDTQYSLPTLKI
jgi:hypothetical protein